MVLLVEQSRWRDFSVQLHRQRVLPAFSADVECLYYDSVIALS